MDHHANPDHPIHELLVKRWSPYAFAEKSVPADILRSLFEAASWAASSYNEQPWRFIVATKDQSEPFERMVECLGEPNRVWAKHVPVLALGFSKKAFSYNGSPNRVAQHDLGAAACSLTLEATARGLVVHQMAGIDPEKIRETYGVPDEFVPETALAIGYEGDIDNNPLPEELKQRDHAERTRKPLTEIVFAESFGTAAGFVGE